MQRYLIHWKEVKWRGMRFQRIAARMIGRYCIEAERKATDAETSARMRTGQPEWKRMRRQNEG